MIVNEHEAVWSSLLRGRYGDSVINVLIEDVSVLNSNGSIWWGDLILSDNSVSINDNHFTSAISSKVNNGRGTVFWNSKWLGNQFLKKAFPEAFVAASNKCCSVAEAGFWSGSVWN